MKLVVWSRFSKSTIAGAIGEPEYSYYFVLKEFIPLLERIGSVLLVEDEDVAASQYEELCRSGEDCVFLKFTAPHNIGSSGLGKAVPVFAWEFDTIPTEAWDGNNYNNWSMVLEQCGAAITHSGFTVEAVKKALGAKFPVIAIPAPVWDRCADARAALADKLENLFGRRILEFWGVVCDSKDIDFERLISEYLEEKQSKESQHEPESAPALSETAPKSLRIRLGMAKNLLIQIYRECVADLLPLFLRSGISKAVHFVKPLYRFVLKKPGAQGLEVDVETERTDQDRANMLEISGVVYTSIFNPADGRKNWETMLSAFCWAFRDKEDATLVIKVSSNQIVFFSDQVTTMLRRLRPFKCRIVIIKAFLEPDQYQRLLASSSYYVNTSYGEGQCLPLMEFLSSGIPALAPANSAMADYMSDEVGFVIESRPEPTQWQHDPRRMLRALHYKADWLSTVKAFESSYQLIREDVESYREMSHVAAARMKEHCSIDVLKGPLQEFLRKHGSAVNAARDAENSDSAEAYHVV